MSDQMFICGHDDDGKILGWWPADRADEVLGTPLEVNEETWRNASQVIYATHVDADRVFRNEHADHAQTLDELKGTLKANIDNAAEIERLKYITPGAGQAMTYQQKNDEATRILAADNPAATDYPLLSAEVGITADDISAVAAVIRTAYAQWQVIGAAIEGIRLGTKKAIDAAETVEAAHMAYAAAIWPTAGA